MSAATEDIVARFRTEGLEDTLSAFDKVSERSRQTAAGIESSTQKMDVNYTRLGMNIAHISTAALSLESTWDRVARGQTSLAEGIVRSIPAFVSLTSAAWTVVTAEKARALAHAIAHAVANPLAIPVIAASAAAAAAIVSATTSRVPAMKKGGIVVQPTIALVGEEGPEAIIPLKSMRRETPSVTNYNITIKEPVFRNRRDMLFMISKLKRLGLA